MMQKYTYRKSQMDGWMEPQEDPGAEFYLASDVEAVLQSARELMRDLWRADENISSELADRCTGFMGGG
jgi:hypothetical protein